jgi:hypothetical protein
LDFWPESIVQNPAEKSLRSFHGRGGARFSAGRETERAGDGAVRLGEQREMCMSPWFLGSRPRQGEVTTEATVTAAARRDQKPGDRLPARLRAWSEAIQKVARSREWEVVERVTTESPVRVFPTKESGTEMGLGRALGRGAGPLGAALLPPNQNPMAARYGRGTRL